MKLPLGKSQIPDRSMPSTAANMVESSVPRGDVEQMGSNTARNYAATTTNADAVKANSSLNESTLRLVVGKDDLDMIQEKGRSSLEQSASAT